MDSGFSCDFCGWASVVQPLELVKRKPQASLSPHNRHCSVECDCGHILDLDSSRTKRSAYLLHSKSLGNHNGCKRHHETKERAKRSRRYGGKVDPLDLALVPLLIGVRKRKYTKEILEQACEGALSFSDVLRNLGLQTKGSSWQQIRNHMKQYGLDQFPKLGKSWSKGLTKDSDSRIKKQAQKISLSDSEVFIVDGPPTISGPNLMKRLIKLGWEYKCMESDCQLVTWKGKFLRLHLDHKNGRNNDNRFENLRFLCPNCHQQTPTWGNKKRACIPTAEKNASEAL